MARPPIHRANVHRYRSPGGRTYRIQGLITVVDETPVDDAPTFGSAEVGAVNRTTVVVTFSENISASDYAAGVTIKKGGVAQTISSATRQADNSIVRYVLAAAVDPVDAVTWEYSAAAGSFVDSADQPLADVAAQPVTNNTTYRQKVLELSPNNYWPLSETDGFVATDLGSDAINGAIVGAAPAAGIGDGAGSMFFDGINDHVKVLAGGMAAGFNNQTGTLSAWFKIDRVETWGDGKNRHGLMFYANTTNYITIRKPSSNNALRAIYYANATSKAVSINTTTTDWMHMAITWSKPADQVIIYVNGAQYSTIQTGLGAWNGGNIAKAYLGAASSPDDTPYAAEERWAGWLARVGYWKRALTATEIAQIGAL